jgi:AbrB family looped-hinge helix DNA binding protein
MTVKVSPKYQVVIPEEVRKALGIKPGMKMNVIRKGRVAYIVPVTKLKELQSELAGSLDQIKVRDKKDRV